MSKLNEFLNAFSNSNYIPIMVWSKLIKDITKEEKQEIIAWLDENNIGLSPQERIGSIMLINKTTLEFLSTKDIRKLPKSSTFKQPKVKKQCDNINTITCNKFDNDWPCGWLSPKGKLYESDWGQHETEAFKIICSLDKREELRQFQSEHLSQLSRDFLVEKLNWVLLDCPSNCGYLSITWNKLSKSQRIWLEKYLEKINDYDTMMKLLGA